MEGTYELWHQAITAINIKDIGNLLKKYPYLVNRGIVHTRRNGTTYETLPLNMVNQSLEATKVLIQAGADPDERGDGNVLAIHNASFPVTKYLISVGADVNKIGYEECSPLMYEVYMRNYDNVAILIKCGAEVNYQRKLDGNTSLHFAVQKNDVQLIDLLLKAGAITDLRNDKDQTPLEIAQAKNNIEIINKFKV